MNTKQLPYILAIASEGSLSAAAGRLKISQPALSKYLAELEQETGMELFFRHKKRLFPTPAGKAYIEAARQILSIQARTRDAIYLLKEPEVAQLHIGVSPHRGAILLAKILPKFNEAFPQVKLVVHEGYALQLKELLAQGKVDYVITGLPSENEHEFRTLLLHNEEVVLGVPSYHRIAKNYTGSIDCLPHIDLAELKDSYFVMPELPSTLYQVIKPLFERAGFQPLSAFASANIVMAEAMIRSGVGIGFLPASYMRPGKDVVYYRLYQPVYMAVSVLTRRGHEMSGAERYLTFLQLQINSLNPHYHMDWSDTILAIVREFDYTHYFEPYMEL